MTKFFSQVFRKIAQLNEVRKDKRIVLIACTMRSGSTLLKSLLANAPDTSHLPEIDFQQYTTKAAWKMRALSKANIIILKKPAPLEQKDYPKFPIFKNQRIIILIRDAYETAHSMKQMLSENYQTHDRAWPYEKLVNEYWYNSIKNILQKSHYPSEHTFMVRYEDLLENPKEWTRKLFTFIGSKQTQGVDHYAPPKNYEWKWGNDDGGDKIKTLKVQKQKQDRTNLELLQVIEQSEKVKDLRQQLGYIN